MEPPGPPPNRPTVMQTCSLADCFKPATSDQRLPWKPNSKQRQRSALLADFEKDGYYLCADHRCTSSENNKTICTDVAVTLRKCQYHHTRAVKQNNSVKKSSSNIGPRGPLDPPQQASPIVLLDPPQHASFDNVAPGRVGGTLPQPSASTNNINPHTVIGSLPPPSASTISNSNNPGSLTPPLARNVLIPPLPQPSNLIGRPLIGTCPSTNTSLYWFETIPSDPIIRGNIIPILGSYLLMPDSASMDSEAADILNKNAQELKRLIRACDGRTVERVTAEWAWCMSRLVSNEQPCLALHQASPIDAVPAGIPLKPAFASSFFHSWHRYCKTWDVRLLVLCTARNNQNEVVWERRRVVHEDEMVFHSHEALIHAPMLQDIFGDSLADGRADLEGYRYVSTPGALWEIPVDMPRLLQLTSGRLACFVSDDTVTSLAILSSGHSLILRPGVKLTVYSIEPSIMQFRGFLDYRSIRLVNPSSPRIIQVVTCYMGMALEEGTWDPTDIEKVLAGFKHTEAEDELVSSLRQMARFALDDKVLARPARG